MTTQTLPGTGYAAAVDAFRRGDLRAAHEALTGVLAADPDHVGSLFGLARCEVKLGNDARAEPLLRRLLTVDPVHEAGRQELAALTARQRARSGPPGSQALAAMLDAPDADATGAAGPVLYEGTRPLLTHRRLVLALAVALAVPTLLAKRHGALRASEAAVAAGSDPLNALIARQQLLLGQAYAGAAWMAGLLCAGLVLAAWWNASITHYTVRTRAVEVVHGVFLRSRRVIWLYDVLDVRFEQNPLLLLLGTGRLVLIPEKGMVTAPGSPAWQRWRRLPAITGLGDAAFLRGLQDDMFRCALLERRTAKKTFM